MDVSVFQSIKIKETNNTLSSGKSCYGDYHLCETGDIDCVTGKPVYVDCYSKNEDGKCPDFKEIVKEAP
jgi:hypothetical protein